MSEAIRSSRNPRLVEIARLHRSRERKDSGRTLIEGPHLLADAYASGVIVDVVVALEGDSVSRELAGRHRTQVLLVDEAGLGRVAGTTSPRGPVGVIEVPEGAQLRSDALLVSWGVSDPGNVGTLIRTAAAFGWGFAYAEGTADPWSPKVLRSGAGSQFGVDITAVTRMEEISDAGYETLALVVEGGVDLEAVPLARPAVIVGEEAAGLSPELVDQCDAAVTIDMPGGTESLNAAVAAGIVVHGVAARLG